MDTNIKKRFLIVVISLFMLFPKVAFSDLTTKDGFLEEIKISVKKKDKDVILSLFNWDGIKKKIIHKL